VAAFWKTAWWQQAYSKLSSGRRSCCQLCAFCTALGCFGSLGSCSRGYFYFLRVRSSCPQSPCASSRFCIVRPRCTARTLECGGCRTSCPLQASRTSRPIGLFSRRKERPSKTCQATLSSLNPLISGNELSTKHRCSWYGRPSLELWYLLFHFGSCRQVARHHRFR